MLSPLLSLPPNRVRRNYKGGASLDVLESKMDACDGNRPEDWIASTTRATNPGLSAIRDEGLATVYTADGSQSHLVDLFATAPEYFLGGRHVSRLGIQLGFLAKLLDSAMRLHVQAHPTAAFAREHLSSKWGKLETYVILSVRPGVEPYIRLGFQRPPSPKEWRRIVLEQDIRAMDACFDRIPVKPGEVWLVPGGLPHAIGEGVLMLEVMEPTDLVVRCEFEREGIVVPPEARFMQRDPEFALQIFDYSPLSAGEVRERYRIQPRRESMLEEQLIGPEHTDCFTIARFSANHRAEIPAAGKLRIGVVASGSGNLKVGGQQIALRPGSRFLLAACAPEAEVNPIGEAALQILVCSPGEA